MKTLLDLWALDFAAFMVLCVAVPLWSAITGQRDAMSGCASGVLLVLGYILVAPLVAAGCGLPVFAVVYAAAWIWGAIFGLAPYR